MNRIAILLLLCFSLTGATINDAALGSSLAGAIVTVTRFGGSMSSATFVASGAGASATAFGSAGFSLVVTPGDTSTATWTLTNTDTSSILLNRITAVTIDLTLSGIAVFDSGGAPSTPFSGPGVGGVSYVSGVTILSAMDLLPWTDPANTGDIFRALTVNFGAGFTALESSTWLDDTDVVDMPEPLTSVLAATALLAVFFLARRADRGKAVAR